jgi:hypothetical protein
VPTVPLRAAYGSAHHRGVVSAASAGRAQHGTLVPRRRRVRIRVSWEPPTHRACVNGFDRRWLYRAGVRARVGGPYASPFRTHIDACPPS